MDEIDLLEQIKRKLEALQARIEARADPRLIAEVADTIRLAGIHLPSVFMQARRVLEIIVRDIYRREVAEPGSKPLADMIKALYEQKRSVIGARIATDLHYIRANGNLIIHPQDESVDINPRDAEPVLFMLLNVVEWYLTQYLPERQGEAAPRPSAGQPTLPPPPNPYRGLLAFREEDAGNWFGREPDADDLLTAVERQPLVAVVGPSGSGKSSLVYAGVVPGLRANEGLRIADFRPRGRPFAELAQALVALWPIDPADRPAQTRKLATHLAEAQATLTDAVQETLRQSGGSRLVLIADQFEELYTLGQSSGETQCFADLLVQAVQDTLAIPNRAGPPELCLLLTLRADFLGHALAHPGFAALLDRCPPKLLGPVEDRARLRAIIEQPARGVGVVLEDLLPERILRDLAQLPGTADQVGGASLPLLEFALAQLWGQQQERRLTHRGYEELGGIQQALSRHADGVRARLDPADQARMRHVLVQMVRPGEGTEDTRQVATRDQLRPDDWPLVVRLADADSRLVVTGHDETTDQDTAEIVHETLIRHWQPLREWLNADRAFRLWQNGLRQAMAEWSRTGQDDGALLAGARLAEAEERIATDVGRVSEAEVRYVQASVGRRDAEAAERERQRRERERLQRRISLGLAGFLVVALVLSGLAGWQWRVADERGAQAREQFLTASVNLARAHEEKAVGILSRPAEELGTRDYQGALLQALQAQRQPVNGRIGLRPDGFAVLDGASLDRAFVQRWVSPNPRDGSWFSAVAFSPDGSLLASASGNSNGENIDGENIVRLWNPATGAAVHVLLGHQVPVNAIAFSPDGRLLASASWDNTVRIWDTTTGVAVRTLQGHQNMVNAVAFSPVGGLLASASLDGTMRLWDSATGNLVRLLGQNSNIVTAVTFSPDGRLLASAAMDGRVALWDPATGTAVRIIDADALRSPAIAFSPDGRVLASASLVDRVVRTWDPATGAAVRSFKLHQLGVKAVTFSPDGRLLATASLEDHGMVRLWDPVTGAAMGSLEGHHLPVNAIAFSPDGRRLASVSADNTIRICDVTTEAAVYIVNGPVKAVAFSPDGRLLAVASEDSAEKDVTVHLWDPATGAAVRTLEGHRLWGRTVAFSPNGRLLASIFFDGTLGLWEPATGTLLRTLQGHRSIVDGVAFSPDGRLLASASWDNTIRFWDPTTGAQVRTLDGHTDKVNAVTFSPDGRLLASASSDKTVRFWDPATGATLRMVEEHQGPVTSVAFSPDSRLLASASGSENIRSPADNTVRLWDSTTGAAVRTLKGLQDTVTAIAFSPDGRVLASASHDKTVRVWDSATGTAVRTLKGHRGWVTAVAFSPDERRIASASSDQTVRLWDRRVWPLLTDSPAPSPRAALISEALQRLWGLKVDGLGIAEHDWHGDTLRQGYDIDQEIIIDVRPAEATADPASEPVLRTFDIRPLLDPPPPDKDKLDQFLDWLAEQERLEPRLRAQ